MESKSDWAYLPTLLLDSIMKKLVPLSDYLRFSAVCKNWHSVAVDDNYMAKVRMGSESRFNNQIPKLMIPTKDNSTERRGLYDVCQGKTYDFELAVPYNNRRCCGSSHGWLAFAMDDLVITLFNPFSGQKLHLPRLQEKEPHYDPQYFVKKVVVSANPSINLDDFEAVAIYGDMQRLAVIKYGQKTWTPVYTGKSIRTPFPMAPCDVIYHKARIYAVSFHHDIISIINTSTPEGDRRLRTKVTPEIASYTDAAYLVESFRGELFMVGRFYSEDPDDTSHLASFTSKVEVYKLVSKKFKGTVKNKLKRVSDLDGDAFFLGDNYSMSIRASDFPGCRPNSIYFTDDCIDFRYPKGPCDISLFNLKDQSFQVHYTPNSLHKNMAPPIWIIPTPN